MLDLKGNREERITMINSHCQLQNLRSVCQVVSVTKSPMREENIMCTLIEIEGQQKEKGFLASTTLFAVPFNEKMPWIVIKEPPEQFVKDKFVQRNPSHRYYMVKIDEWLINQKRPHGKILEHVGEAGNLNAESMRILKTNDICTDSYDVNGVETMHESLKIFTKDVDPETKEWIIPEEEIKQRLDLRKKRIFSIDPVTAKDIDDCLSIEKISDRIYEIGVHIADVSFFVTQGSDLDLEALKRGSSTYMVHKVFPMLPRLLSERLCSLHQNVDRLAYSIFFRLDLADGKLVQDFQPVIKRTVINSCAKWNYQLAEDIIDNKLTNET